MLNVIPEKQSLFNKTSADTTVLSKKSSTDMFEIQYAILEKEDPKKALSPYKFTYDSKESYFVRIKKSKKKNYCKENKPEISNRKFDIKVIILYN